MHGYTLDQLLDWAIEDGVVEGFEVGKDSIAIRRNGQNHELKLVEARRFMKSLFRQHGRDAASGARRNEA